MASGKGKMGAEGRGGEVRWRKGGRKGGKGGGKRGKGERGERGKKGKKDRCSVMTDYLRSKVVRGKII